MILLLAGFTLLALIELPPLLFRREKRTLTAFLAVFFIGLVLSIMLVRGIEVPSILLLLDHFFRTLGLHY
jgi:hypothetical protein